MMRILMEFITKFRDYLVLVFLVVISLSLISIFTSSKMSGFRATLVGTVGWMQDFIGFIPDISTIKSENKAVRELNLTLSSEIMQSRKSLYENRRLRELLGLKEELGDSVVIADVVGSSSVELRNYITINRGAIDGIKEGMCVRTDAGLVGLIIGVQKNYALVELIKNRNVQISSKVQRNSVNGVFVWEGGDYFLLKNIPSSHDVKVGDVIVTSNYSNRYVPELPIGTVISVSIDPSSLFHNIKIKSYADMSALEQVFIIKFVPDEERQNLIKEMEARLQARKK